MSQNTVDAIVEAASMHQHDRSSAEHGNEIAEIYENASEESRKLIDDLLMCLCGWTHNTLMSDYMDNDPISYVDTVVIQALLDDANSDKESDLLHRRVEAATPESVSVLNEVIERLTGVTYNYFESQAAA